MRKWLEKIYAASPVWLQGTCIDWDDSLCNKPLRCLPDADASSNSTGGSFA